jgi:hypothetical protein
MMIMKMVMTAAVDIARKTPMLMICNESYHGGIDETDNERALTMIMR